MVQDNEDWISANAAITLLKPVMSPSVAAMNIAARANDGMIRARADRFTRGRRVLDDAEVPAQFWWARGHAALEQNWVTGDFETWIDHREQWKAYGVRFLRSQILNMLPNSRGRANHPLTEEDLGRLFGVLLAELHTLSLTNARLAVAAAGITGVNAPTQYWDPFITGVEKAFYRMEPESRLAALRILADKFSDSEVVQRLFAQHGYEYVDGSFVPAGLLDQREARYLPRSSAGELAKAMKRLVDGDETGAITAACGAIDTLMQQIYMTHNLGDPAHVAFAAKVNTAAKQLRIFEEMKNDLFGLGINSTDAKEMITNLQKATNHAVQMLQTLRRTMGDVHGSKPTLRRPAYDAIKWASAICGLFEGYS